MPRLQLTTMATRIALLESLGVDEVVVQPVDRAWLEQSPEAFITGSVLPCGADVVVEGPDFRFGAGRVGDIEMLSELGRRFGFDVEAVPPVSAALCNLEQVPVRSSRIRRLVTRGRVQDAARLLGRSWRMEGTVVRGDQRGRTIGCPTANFGPADVLLPADGVYAGTATCPDGTFPAAISVGTKPTFADAPRVFETHLIGWDGGGVEYGWPLQVDVHRWLRDQIAYESLAALQEQIARDITAATSIQ